jgi:hypothetical protein
LINYLLKNKIMSVFRFVAIATLSSLVLFSCTKEDFTVPPPNEFSPTATTNESAANPIIKTPYVPVAVSTIHTCGNSIVVDIENVANPTQFYFEYEVRMAGTNIIVDSGSIRDGESTNGILNPCQDYDFVFWGSSASDHSTSKRITSDGCNGTYSC